MTWSGFSTATTGTTRTWTLAPAAVHVSLDQPMLLGEGPAEFSTCTDLAVSPEWVWDVNGYYRSLGVPTTVGKRGLRVAYQRLDGQSSPWLTYCLKQLLDDGVRAAYDRMPLGIRFYDRYVAEEIARAAKLAAAQAANVARQRYGADIDPEELFKEAMVRKGEEEGYRISFDPDDDEDTPEESRMLDTEDGGDEADPPRVFYFAFYQWRTECADIDRLIRWQDLLVTAFSKRRVNIKIAVGFAGRVPQRYLAARVGYRTVVFLNAGEQPTAEVAEAAAVEIERDLRASA